MSSKLLKAEIEKELRAVTREQQQPNAAKGREKAHKVSTKTSKSASRTKKKRPQKKSGSLQFNFLDVEKFSKDNSVDRTEENLRTLLELDQQRKVDESSTQAILDYDRKVKRSDRIRQPEAAAASGKKRKGDDAVESVFTEEDWEKSGFGKAYFIHSKVPKSKHADD